MKAYRTPHKLYKKQTPMEVYDVKCCVNFTYEPYAFFVSGVIQGGLIISGTSVANLYSVGGAVDVYGCQLE